MDDEPAVCAIARRFLERLGYRILEAPGGAAAIQASREYPGKIHLLLAEVLMAHMSGRELAFQLAPERPEMKVIYTSGHTEETIVHHGVLPDRMAFLQKPFTLPGMAAKVREVLDRQEAPSVD